MMKICCYFSASKTERFRTHCMVLNIKIVRERPIPEQNILEVDLVGKVEDLFMLVAHQGAVQNIITVLNFQIL